MRCLALAQAWQSAGGSVEFITTCRNDGLLERLRDEGFDVSHLAAPYPDPADREQTSGVLASHPGVWLVLDGYHFDEAYQQQVKAAGVRLLVVDDLARLSHYYADILLNQNLYAPRLRYECEPETCMLLGTGYALLRKEFTAWSGYRREIPDLARRVLVTLGGSDPENLTAMVIQALGEVPVPGLQATVVIGASNPHAAALAELVKGSPFPVSLVYDATNMPELMAEADIAVSSGGSVCWELAFMGLPAAILAWVDNQYPIGEALHEAGAAIDLRTATKMDITTASMAIILKQLLEDGEMRRQMSSRGQQLVDGKGGSRVTAAMLAARGA